MVNLVQGLGGPLEDCSYSRLRENENVGSLLPGKKKGTRAEWMSDDDAALLVRQRRQSRRANRGRPGRAAGAGAL